MLLTYELPWDGRPFEAAPFLAFDTETAVHAPGGRVYNLNWEVPPLVLATASDGTRNVVVYPEQMPDFVRFHQDTLLVGHNIAFDFWATEATLRQYHGLRGVHNHVALDLWMDMPDRGLMDDTMYLDFLVRLARDAAAYDGMRNLGQVAALVGLEADKESPYRLRFEELIGADWSQADPGFFQYAVADTYVTWHVYQHLLRAAQETTSIVSCEEWEQHGPLTSKLQTRASIVLAQMGRNGMCMDQDKLQTAKVRLQADIRAAAEHLATYSNPSLFSYYTRNRTGELKVNPVTGVPRLKLDALGVYLRAIAAERGWEEQHLPRTATGRLATRLEFWRQMAAGHPLVDAWATMMDRAKVLQFVCQLEGHPAVHARYQTLVRTGRTSCRSPNIQQMPKEPWFRNLFVARPGHKYVIVDYSAIELRTLAAVCLHRYGHSVLGEVIKAGRCPHTYTAAMIAGWDYDTALAGVKREKAAGENGPFSRARQSAKPINFGVPGGLGADKLAAMALSDYGVVMTPAEAKQFRDKLVYEVYPELAEYMKYDIYAVLARNMQCPEKDIRAALEGEGLTEWYIERVVRRDGVMGSKKSLPAEIRAFVWEVLGKLNRNPALQSGLDAWESDIRGLCSETVTTLTGRVRAGVSYTEARNTPFQGLAADGAKVALWRLHQDGYRLVAFVHDEIVAEVPEDRAAQYKANIERIMCDSMASVLDCDIPVAVEGSISGCWLK